jgi:hypothetical protein
MSEHDCQCCEALEQVRQAILLALLDISEARMTHAHGQLRSAARLAAQAQHEHGTRVKGPTDGS